METSCLTILLFFLIVFLFLAAFLLYIFISRRTTPPSQRLTQWLKAQSEADLLVETMASQGMCVVEGLHPCRRRDRMRRRQEQRRRQQAERNRHGEDTDGSIAGGNGTGGGNGSGGGNGGGEYDEEMAMEDLWKRYQRQRSEDPATLIVHGAITNSDSNSAHGVSSESDPTGTRMDRVVFEDMVAEKLWEYIVGWCLVGCVFVGVALIIAANFMIHGDNASETPWTFDPEDGDSLMDTIVENIMKAALGMKDFQDQLMELGIFVFIVGVNGFILVRQQVYGRRKHYEQELMRSGMVLPSKDPMAFGGSGFHVDGKNIDDRMLHGEANSSEEHSEGKQDFYDDLHLHQATHGIERFTSTDQVVVQVNNNGTTTTTATVLSGAGMGGGSIQNPPNTNITDLRPSLSVSPASKSKETSATKDASEEKKISNDDSPDFATMSFLAWFNYLQVGILVIEFLQLFSFPLRELMGFYKQAEKTSAMYDGAKTILEVFRTTATNLSTGANGGSPVSSTATTATVNSNGNRLPGIHYKDGILSIGNNTLFDFNPRNNSSQDKNSAERPTFALDISEDGHSGQDGSEAAVLDQNIDGMGLIQKNISDSMGIKSTTALSAAALTTPHPTGTSGNSGSQKLGASADWIKENLPLWLPNITALMDNNTVGRLEPGRFEELRDNLVNAAVGVALRGFAGTNSTLGANSTTLSDAGASGGSGTIQSSADKIAANRGVSNNSGGEGDIVMQVVGSLGLQPSINTHDWYLLRFWSCFAAVVLGWIVALSIHAWNRRCRRLRREGRPHWSAISVGWVSCFIPVVSVLYLPILSTFLSSAACQSQAIHAYAHEKYTQQQEQAQREGHGLTQATGVFSSVIMTLLDPASTVAAPSASSLLCTGPLVQPALYLMASLFAYTLAYVLFMVFLTSFERVPAKGEICFRPNGVAVLKNLGLLLAVDFLMIQSPAQRRFRGLVSIGIMLAMACYTIRMKPCYWNKINYWRTFSFSCVLYASLLVALLCPTPALEKSGRGSKAEREHQLDVEKWVMAPNLKIDHGWIAGGGPKTMLAWIAVGWVLLVIVFIVVERVFLRHWTKKETAAPIVRSVGLLNDGYGYRSGGGIGGGMDMVSGPEFPSDQTGGSKGDIGAFTAATPVCVGMNYSPTVSGSHWSVVDLSQTPEARRSKALNPS